MARVMTPAEKRAADISESLLTNAYSSLGADEQFATDALKAFQSDEELAAETGRAKSQVGTAREKLAEVDKAGTEEVKRTERQQLTETIIQGLGKVLGGILGEKEGFTADIKTQPSDFGAILAGRMKDIENKRRTAEGELGTAEQQLRDRLTRAERVKDMRGSSALELAQAKAQAALRLYLEEQQNRIRAGERAADEKSRKEQMGQINIAAATQQFAEQSKQLKADSEKLSELLGQSKDPKKGDVAATQLANKLGMLTSEFNNLSDDDKELKVQEIKAKMAEQEAANDQLRTRLGMIKKTGDLGEPLKKAMQYVAAGFNVAQDKTKPTGELILPDAATVIKQTSEPLLALTAAQPANTAVQDKVKKLAKDIYGMGILATGAEDSGLKKIIQSGNFQGLTQEEAIAISTTPLFKQMKEDREVQQAVLSTVNKLKAADKFKALQTYVPGTMVNLYGIEE